jgi:predicted nucleic acid-binding protein
VTDVPGVRVSSDPYDNKFLATADAGRADYVVTGDLGDLLRLRKYKQVTIISPREFVSVLRT